MTGGQGEGVTENLFTFYMYQTGINLIKDEFIFKSPQKPLVSTKAFSAVNPFFQYFHKAAGKEF